MGPPGCGKSCVVYAALQRAFRRQSPDSDCHAGCPKCNQPLLLCNPGYKVLSLHAPSSSAEAFTLLANLINECKLNDDELESETLKRRDVDMLTNYFGTYQRRLLLWLQGDFNKSHLQEFLYVITNMIHNKDAIKRVSVIFETRAKLSVDLDARISSRISQATVDFRGFNTAHLAAFISDRLSYSTYSSMLFHSLHGGAGDSHDTTSCATYFIQREAMLRPRYTEKLRREQLRREQRQQRIDARDEKLDDDDANTGADEEEEEEEEEVDDEMLAHTTLEEALAAALLQEQPVYAELCIHRAPQAGAGAENSLPDDTLLSCAVMLFNGRRLPVDLSTGEVGACPLGKKRKRVGKEVPEPQAPKHGGSVLRRELWPEPNSNMTGLWFSRKNGRIAAVGITTVKKKDKCYLYAARKAGVSVLGGGRRQLAIDSWNAIVRGLASSPLFLERLKSQGDFTMCAQMLCTWLMRIGLALSRRGTNALTAAWAQSIQSEVAEGGCEAIANAVTGRLAFHFHTTMLYRHLSVPASVSKEALCINHVAQGVVTHDFLDRIYADLQRQGACYTAPHVDFSSASTSQVLLLCLLVKGCQALHEQELKRARKAGLLLEATDANGNTDTINTDVSMLVGELSMEVMPKTLLDDYIDICSHLVATHAVQRYDWPSIMNSDLQALLDMGMISLANARARPRTVSDARVHLLVDRVNLVEYLRAHRDAGSASSHPNRLFSVLNLDEDVSLI
eukprot:TRINITY_DN4954_c4_g1_i1.p1 TRINITY_DN4954_c4_g1~~TRINITY_DN4954_c4_g1_i1.p1  ORF type:complete len:805 (+),score=214.45 TRINITY_DN4954_c4_g1_i1:215-2416(+)